MRVFDLNGDLEPGAVEVLYEIGNVGVGTAVMAIGNLREMEIRIGTPNVIAVNKDIFTEIDYDPEQIVVGVITKLSDTLKGTILFLLGKEFVRNTVYKMTDEKYSDDQLLTDEDSMSAIQEMVNYMTAGYAKVIGSYMNMPIYIKSASLGMSKAEDVVREAMQEVGEKIEKIACVNTRFRIIDEDGRKTDEAGQVLILPDEKSIEKIMELLS